MRAYFFLILFCLVGSSFSQTKSREELVFTANTYGKKTVINYSNCSLTDTLFNVYLLGINKDLSENLILKVDTFSPSMEASYILENSDFIFLKYSFTSNKVKNEKIIKPNISNSKFIFNSIPSEFINLLFLLIGAFLSHSLTKNREKHKAHIDFFNNYIASYESHIKDFYNYCEPVLTHKMITEKYNELLQKCLIPPSLDKKITSSLDKFENANTESEKIIIIEELKNSMIDFLFSPYKRVLKKIRQLTSAHK
jgi:hypothetical protein